jgi:NYN domain
MGHSVANGLAQRIAVLVDADNVQGDEIGLAVEEARRHGAVAVRRAFGRLTSIKGCEAALTEFGFMAEVVFPPAQSGKNAADLMMAQYAVRLAERKAVDMIVLVSSDADFAPVAIALAEAGVQTIGVGRSGAPPALQNACASFVPVTAARALPIPVAHQQGRVLCSDLQKLRKIVDNVMGKNGRAKASALGKQINLGFGGDYRKHFGLKSFSQVIGLIGYRIEGSGPDMQVARADTSAGAAPAGSG